MAFELIRVAIAVAGTGLAARQDWKTSFIDERITYAMIAAGLLLNLATFDQQLIIFSLGGAALIFGVGYLLYKTGKLGGGDVLLYAGLHLLLPYNPMLFGNSFADALLGQDAFFKKLVLQELGGRLPFFFTVFMTSTILALAYSAILYAMELRGRKLKPNLLEAGIGVAVIAALVYFSSATTGFTTGLAALYAAVFIPALFLLSFRTQIMEEVVVKRISLAQVEDEDVLALDKLPGRIVEKYGLRPVITKSELEKLRRVEKLERVHKFPVAKVLPRLGPSIFAALALGLLGIDPLMLLLILA